MNNSYSIGVDIGGTKIAFALINRNGDLLDFLQVPTRLSQNANDMISEIALNIQQLISKAKGEFSGIGIGCPGQVSPQTGIVQNAVNLGWHDVNLAGQLTSLLSTDKPIFVRKDADASLLGEYYFGAAKTFSDVLYVCIGSGLGASVLSNKYLVEGSTGTAAGIGHIKIEDNENLCSCGLIGCAETLISGPGLVKEAQRLIKAVYSKSDLVDNESLTSSSILEKAKAGDPLATRSLSNLACGLGRVLALCISIINPALIVIGGGLGVASFDQIIPLAVDEMKKHALPHTHQNLQIVPTKLSSSAIGAASLVWNL